MTKRIGVEQKKLIELLQEEIQDYRKGNGVRHELSDVIIIGLLCILCNGNTFVDMQTFGETHEDLLRQFLPLPQGIPSHDTFGHVFARLDPGQLVKCFGVWIEDIKQEMESHHIAVDGKTIRGSGRTGNKAKHIITAFASELQLVLGQLCVDGKNNEITEIPRLLDMFCVKGSTITIDAMGTQKEIAGKIIEKGGEYVLALKDNHANLHDDIRFYAQQEIFPQDTKGMKEKGAYHSTLEKDHGRIETRKCWLLGDLNWLDRKHDWAGLSGAAAIYSKRVLQSTGEISESVRYFLYSEPGMTAERLLALQRSHWRIENNLHWMLDMVFREDSCQVRIENAAEILNILRKLCLQLVKQESSVKASMQSKRLRCSYDIHYALKVLGVSLA